MEIDDYYHDDVSTQPCDCFTPFGSAGKMTCAVGHVSERV